MPQELLRRALQTRLPAPAPQLPASVAVGLALPVAGLGIVLIGMNLHLLGMLAWLVAIGMMAFALDWRYALAVIAGVTLCGALLWKLLLGEAAILSHAEQVAFALATALAAVVGQMVAREGRQRETIAADSYQLDVFANTIESIFSASRSCIKLLSMDGSVLAINDRGLALIGAERDEQIIGRNWFSLWGPEQQKVLATAWETLRASGRAEFDGSCRIFTGERRNWSNTFTLVRTPAQDRAFVICISTDVTDSVALQQTAKISAVQISGLLDSIDDAAFVVDNDWLVEFANPRAEQLFAQQDGASLLRRDFREIFALTPEEPAAIAIRRALEQQTMQRCENFYYAPQQKWFRVTACPFPGGLNVLVRDITTLREAQQTAAEKTACLQAAQDIAEFGDWSFDCDQGAMQFSPRAVAMLELDNCAAHEQKKCLLEKLDPHDRMALVQAIINCTEAAPSFDVVVRMPLRSGADRHLRWLGRRLSDERRWNSRLVGVIQDIGAQVPAPSAGHLIAIADRKAAPREFDGASL